MSEQIESIKKLNELKVEKESYVEELRQLQLKNEQLESMVKSNERTMQAKANELSYH